MKILRTFVALALAISLPLPVFAQQHPSGSRPAPQSRPAAPAARPAAPQTRPAPGYDLNHDTAPRPPANTPQRPPNNNPAYRPVPPVQRPPGGGQPPAQRPPAPRPPNPSYRPPGYHPPRPPVPVYNPVWRGRPAWGWNRGVAWYPATGYWGGGFWGTLAIAATSAAIFGYIVGSTGQEYVSYQVEPSSPGAQLLQSYQLTQTPCGPPNLVVIYGPDNSVICAYPNNIVSAGTYSVDPATLTLSSY